MAAARSGKLSDRKPEISVLMPVHNGEAFLAEAIESILAQTLEAFELIVVDDGSTDGSAAIVDQFAERDARVRLLPIVRSGIVGALEAGRAAARAPLVARMDADDVAMPGRFALQRGYLAANPAIVALGGQVDWIDGNGSLIGRGRYPVAEAACASYLHRGSPLCHPAVMMRAGALDACGGYSERHGSAEDYDLWLRLSRLGGLANLPDTILRYRLHGSNVTVTKADRMAVSTALAYLDAFHPVEPDPLPEADRQGGDWMAIEARLPETVRLIGRMAYLRALSLNGGIVSPHNDRLLARSIQALQGEARRTGRRADLAFMLLRAARHFARAGKAGRAVRLAATAAITDPAETARTLGARLLRCA